MIRIGIAGIPHSVKGKGTEAGIAQLHALGLDAMEVQFGRNVYMTPEAAERVAPVARKADVSLSVHAPYYVNLTSRSVRTREKSRGWILGSARVAAALGASVVAIHAARDRDTDVVVASFRDLVRTLKKEGVTVPLGLETMGDAGGFGSLDDVLEVVRKVPGTTAVLDFAHLHARTGGGLESARDFGEAFDRADRAIKGGYHIHFSGIEHRDSREVRHLPLGEGGPDVRLFARALAGRGRAATIICESPLLEEDALRIKQAFQSLRGAGR